MVPVYEMTRLQDEGLTSKVGGICLSKDICKVLRWHPPEPELGSGPGNGHFVELAQMSVRQKATKTKGCKYSRFGSTQ